MTTSNKNILISLTLASAMLTLGGCGGGDSKKSAVDTTGVTEVKLKESLKDGLTKGLSSNMDALESTLTGVNDSIQSSSKQLAKLSNNQPLTSTATNSLAGNIQSSNNDIVNNFNLLIDNSSYTQSGNVYTFDPDEVTICADPSLNNTPQKITKCNAFLSHITFVSTVTAVDSNNDVTAADTAFKYDTTTFSQLGFTGNSSYYQLDLDGVPAVLTGMKLADPSNQMDIPDSMSGSLRIASSAPTSTNGTLTVSIPTTISITDNAPQTAINIAATNNLLIVTADSATNTIDVEVGISALDILLTEEDDQGNSFPQQLLINALSGRAVASSNGNTITLTGITANSVQLKIDGTQALSANLTSLNAIINTAGNQNIITLGSALNFDLNMTNVRGFIDDSKPDTNILNLTVDAPSGTVATEATTNDLVKITTGSLVVTKTETGSTTINTSVPIGSCINTKNLSLDSSANCQ